MTLEAEIGLSLQLKKPRGPKCYKVWNLEGEKAVSLEMQHRHN